MVGQIILGILGIVIGGGTLITFVVSLLKPTYISAEEMAALEERKRKGSKVGYIPPLKHIGGGLFAPNDIL